MKRFNWIFAISSVITAVGCKSSFRSYYPTHNPGYNIPASSYFKDGDVVDGYGFATNIFSGRTNANSFSALLWSKFCETAKSELTNATTNFTDVLDQTLIVEALNQFLTNPCLESHSNIFASITLSDATKELAAEHPKGERLRLLNRLLLEDTYPISFQLGISVLQQESIQ